MSPTNIQNSFPDPEEKTYFPEFYLTSGHTELE